MCEHWAYGCGHDVRTTCPRPKPGSSNPSSIQSTPSRHSSASSGPTASTTSIRTPINNGNGALTIMSLPDSLKITAFCKGFPLVPKETDYPCYACIQANTRSAIVREAVEVQAEKERLKESGLSRTSAKSADGSYTDEWGRKITKEDAFYQEESYGRTQTRTFSGARAQDGRGPGSFSGSGYGNGFSNSVQSGYGGNLDAARENGNARPRGFTDSDGGGGYGAFGRHGGFPGASGSNGYDQGSGYIQGISHAQGNGYVQQNRPAQGNGFNQQDGYAQNHGFAPQIGYGGHGPGFGSGSYASHGQAQRPLGNGGMSGGTWRNNNGFGQSLNGYGQEPYSGNGY